MKIANLNGELGIVEGSEYFSIKALSNGLFSGAPLDVYGRWGEFTAWAKGASLTGGIPFTVDELDAPSPEPRQVFAAAVNYSDHAAESRVERPALPLMFTKFPSSITSPNGDVPLPSDWVDWEAELVVIIGEGRKNVTVDEAWSLVAGLSVGQDYSERSLQLFGQPPQLGLGKSYPRFSPIGPWLITPDELPDPNALPITCTINGEVVQEGNTANMLFSVAELVSFLSYVLELYPGDVIFTGTPSGIGLTRIPTRGLKPGEVIVTSIEGIGEIVHTAQAATHPPFAKTLDESLTAFLKRIHEKD